MPVSSSDTRTTRRFASFSEFYPYYLQQHARRASRRLHIAGTLAAMLIAAAALLSRRRAWLAAVPVAGYLPACNSPATFRHPLYSLRGDLSMLRGALTSRVHW
jgi:hypothetical protein